MSTETTTKRQKKVFSSMSHIAHIFSNEPGREARFGNGFIEGDVIYSYGRHFPIARRHVDGVTTTMFFTLREYSNTTRKHINDVRNAIRQHNIVYMYWVPTYGKPNHTLNIDYWILEIEKSIDKFKKARNNKTWILRTTRSHLFQLKKYLEFFKIEPSEKVKTFIADLESDKYEEEIKEYQKKEAKRLSDPKLEEKREKARLARERAEEKANAEQIEKWRNFEAYQPYSKKNRWFNRSSQPDLLRYNAEKQRIETSQNVQIPVEIAHQFYRYIKIMVAKGGCTSADCCNYQLLNTYTVRSITEEGIKVGCHTIEMSEIDYIANLLGWQ